MEKKNGAHELVVESLTGAVLRLIKKKPLSKITISQLCETAGVSRVSFYRNYNSIDDIVVSYMKADTDKIWEKWTKEQKSEDQNIDYWTDLFAYFKSQSQIVTSLINDGKEEIIKRLIFESGGPKPDMTPTQQYISAGIAGLIYGFISQWILKGMPDDIDIKSIRQQIITNIRNEG